MSAAADYRALAKRYRHLPEVVVRAGAAEIKRSVETRLDRDTGGDRVMSGAGKQRTTLGVTVSVKPGRTFTEAEVKPSRKRRSHWSWLEWGTKERIVGKPTADHPDGGVVNIDGKWYTGPWSAGRMRAKHTFSEGSNAGIAAAERAMATEFDKAAR